ncbi:MAG: type ISP restriction/modification enzyme [Thermoleophilia bacterium]
MDPVEAYLAELSAVRASGATVPETSGYGALATLLTSVGHTLKPRVRCLINLANTGAGIPDGGLFLISQCDKANAAEPLPGQLPARGAVEVKPPSDSALLVAHGKQVGRYLVKYRQVLVTTYREFVLVGYDADGQPAALETYSLAATETGFWALAVQPRKAAHEQGERLVEFLKRVLLRPAQIAAPQDLAWFLASYAREARARAEERDLPSWLSTRTALEEALGMSFEGERGEHFFRSTLVQTLFYGLFAAWAFWAEHHQPSEVQTRFRWREAAGYLHIPILQKLFYDFSNPGALGTLHIDEVLDWAGEALNRVDRTSFFSTFEQSHAVQYFYEPFLEAFDPELRKELGVWYTPPEIVTYMVERVDQVLRSELNITDGLADPRVVVLDPCCGTGAYLVEVLNKIAATLAAKSGGDALVAHEIKQAAISRIYGFEILPAPFVISHLQIGMLLHRLGAPFADQSDERAGVFLTNALTGWQPPTEPKQHLLFPEMEEERDKAEAVKQHAPILVILGNPPYNGFAGAAIAEERDLVTAYRTVKKVAAPQGQGLNDLYVRFFRMAERRITEGAEGRGVVCFISNYSWLDGLSFTGMRERYLEVFDQIWIDNLNGDKYKTGKLTPAGDPDPSVFSTEKNREGIQVGTAIALLARHANHTEPAVVHFHEHWGKAKLAELQAQAESAQLVDRSTQADGATQATWAQLQPETAVGLPFLPAAVGKDYAAWPALPALFPVSFPGVKTSRDDVVVDIDRERLVVRLKRYFDPAVSDEEMARIAPGAMESTARFAARQTRQMLLQRGFLPANMVRYCYRPFDNRWLYWEPQTKLLDEKRAEYFPHVFAGNLWMSAGQRNRKEDFYQPQVTSFLADHHIVESNVGMFPARVNAEVATITLLDSVDAGHRPNLSPASVRYLREMSCDEFNLLHHAAAALHALAYAQENAGALRQDWPRIPLPATRDALLASAELGRQVAALLDVEEPVDAVSSGAIRHELRPLGVLAAVSGGQLDPAAGDLAVTAGWGHAGKGGVTMPGRGRIVERSFSEAELAAFREGLANLGLDYEQLMACLGGTCYDVYLNDVAYWRCVPARVWTYTIGGYQVMKKWLSYRERALLGRDLKPDEARYVSEMTRRIAALLLLEPALDENYERVKADTYVWPGAGVDERR